MRDHIIAPRTVTILPHHFRDPRDPVVEPAVGPPPAHLRVGSEPAQVAAAKAAQREERCRVLTALYREDLDGFDDVLTRLHADDPDLWQALQGRAWARAALYVKGLAKGER